MKQYPNCMLVKMRDGKPPLYFNHDDMAMECSGSLITLKAFWYVGEKRGKRITGDAQICEQHARGYLSWAQHRYASGFLVEKILESRPDLRRPKIHNVDYGYDAERSRK